MNIATINGDPRVVALDRALVELRRGRIIAVTDDHSRLLAAALETAGPRVIGLLQHLGPLTLLIPAERALALGLPMSGSGAVQLRLDGTLSAETLALLGQRWQTPYWRGILGSAPLALQPADAAMDAAIALAKAAQLLPAMLVVEAAAHAIPADVLQISAATAGLTGQHAASLSRVSEARVPLHDCEDSRLIVFRDLRDGREHVAVVVGRPDLEQAVPLRVHSACLTGDLLGSLRCDCGEQLRNAVRRLAAAGGGILLYLAQEGRGIGLANKLRAYQLQDAGFDTIDADRQLGFSADERDYGAAVAVLRELGIRQVQLFTNSPHKTRALRDAGISVTEVGALHGTPNRHNARYIRTKQDRAGHTRPVREEAPG